MMFATLLGSILAEIHRWERKYSLDFNYDKCYYTVVKPKGTLKNESSIPIRMDGIRIMFRWQILYLGVTIDKHLSWMHHLTSVQEKAYSFMQKLNRPSSANWAIKPKLRKMLYAVLVELIILYAAPIWYNGKVVVRNRLQIIQRGLLLCIIKCYKMACMDASRVLSGVLPLDLCVELDRDFMAMVRWNESVDGATLDSESVDQGGMVHDSVGLGFVLHRRHSVHFACFCIYLYVCLFVIFYCCCSLLLLFVTCRSGSCGREVCGRGRLPRFFGVVGRK